MLLTEKRLSWVEWIRYSSEAGPIIMEGLTTKHDSKTPDWEIDNRIQEELGNAYRCYKEWWEKNTDKHEDDKK